MFTYFVSGAQVGNWWDNGKNQIAFSRESKGFIAFNLESFALNKTLQASHCVIDRYLMPSLQFIGVGQYLCSIKAHFAPLHTDFGLFFNISYILMFLFAHT